MKNREYTIISVYTQANGEKIAVSMLHTTKKCYFETTKPTAAVEKYGKIEGEINSYWGKLPVVLVPVEQFAALKKEYEIIEYRGPVECTRIRESKPRPDAAALKLYKVFAADAAAPQVDNDGLPVKITVDGYSFYSGAGESLLKALKREYSFSKSDIAAALAMVIDTPADAEPAEQPAPVADTPAPAVEVAEVAADAPALVQAAKETGHLIICSVPKATPAPEVAAPVDVPIESPAPVEDAPAAPAAAGYMSGETTRGRVHYINHQDKAVSRVMDLERVNYPAPLPMWVMADGDYYYMVYQLSDGLFFRPNNSGFTSLNMEAFRGDYSQFSEETISEALANAAAIPAEQFNHKWPNMAVVNAYKAAGMMKEADMLMAVREKIEQEREEKKKAWKEKAEREEKERKQEEENRLNEAAAAMVNNGRITGRDIVALCDREGITINPRTRHNLLEVVNYYEDNRICYKQYGKRKPGLDGCFNVARELLAAITAKLPANAAEDAAPRYLPAPVEIYQQINNIIAAAVPAPQLPEPPAVVYVSEPCPPTPSTLTDADVLATAARIKSLYDTMTAEAAPLPSDMPEPDTTPLYTAADVEAMIEAATADTYTADEVAAMVADAVAQERARHRRRPAPRLRPIFRRLLRVAAVVVPLVVLAMLTASTAADNGHQAPAADAVAMTPAAALPVAVDADTLQVVELPPVTVTTPRTPSGQKTGLTPSGQKTAAAVADASPTDEPTADTPAGQKTDADGLPDTLQPDSQPHGLTICEGTAWAYTMMNWA